jgi:hypothetical protein
LFLVNGLSNEAIKMYGLSMGFSSWAIQELNGKLELKKYYVLVLICHHNVLYIDTLRGLQGGFL